jgi:hypothetical protein
MNPTIIKEVFPGEVFDDLQMHIREVRRAFEGTPFHDRHHDVDNKFNRWYWHNLPLLRRLHYSSHLQRIAETIFPEPVKPSYVFLSLYGEGGICPLHTDRPQCKYTIDLCVSQRNPWPIFVSDQPYLLNPNEALAYSGTDHPHYRNTIDPGNYCNLAFFHYVPVDFQGTID